MIENLPNERVADGEPLTDLFRSADEQVDRKGGPDGHPNCHRLIHRILVGRHDHEQVDVGIWRCSSMGVRPEENHAIGVEFVSNPAADIKDRFHGDHPDILTCMAGVINAVAISSPGVIRTHDQCPLPDGLAKHVVGEAQQLVEDHLQEIIDAWDKHFPN